MNVYEGVYMKACLYASSMHTYACTYVCTYIYRYTTLYYIHYPILDVSVNMLPCFRYIIPDTLP